MGSFHVFATRQHYIPLKYSIDIDWPCTLCACVNLKGNIYKQTKLHAMADIPWAEIAKGTAVFVAGAAGATVGVPAVLGVFGFGAGGIAAGSTAASAMSVAMTKGIGMTAVAAAQSVGAAGISGTTAAAVGGAATGIWTAIKSRL